MLNIDRKNRKAQAPLTKAATRLPNPNSSNAISVTDGTVTVGTIVERDGVHYAFGPTAKLIGKFRTRLEAMRALPARAA